jgi:hypothetical protein
MGKAIKLNTGVFEIISVESSSTGKVDVTLANRSKTQTYLTSFDVDKIDLVLAKIIHDI